MSGTLPIDPLAHSQAQRLETAGNEEPSEAILRDQLLVARCLAGNAAAWTELYDRCHQPLVATIQFFLGRLGSDIGQADEVAARVWYLLVRNDFALLSRFDPWRGCRLTTFLTMLAKNEAAQLLRSERRRRTREQAASKRDDAWHADGEFPAALEQEFLATLTPSELVFYKSSLISQPDSETAARYSQSNTWQLTHRVRQKLSSFLQDLD